MNRSRILGGLRALCFWALASSAFADTSRREGGPDSVEALLDDLQQIHENLLDQDWRGQWDEWKASLAEATGFSFGVDYSTQLFSSSDSPSGVDDDAASGVFRFFGKWDLLNRGKANAGTLNWKVEHRHRYTDTTPGSHSLNLGNVGVMGGPYNDNQLRLTNLYWRQELGERFVTYLGFLDVTDFVDVYALGSPWSGFTNLNFSTGASSMALPPDATFGGLLAGWLTDEVYVAGTIANMNGDPTDPFDHVDSFFSENEYFTSLELGWTPGKDRLLSENVHVTFWHVDDVEATGTPDGWGVNFSAAKWIDESWMPFFRAGWADDGGSLLETSVNVGVATNVLENKALLAIAGNWGQPNEDTFGPDLDDQFGIEAFCRFQLTQSVRITPSVQFLWNPALNQEDDFLVTFGLRAMASF